MLSILYKVEIYKSQAFPNWNVIYLYLLTYSEELSAKYKLVQLVLYSNDSEMFHQIKFETARLKKIANSQSKN